MGCSWAAEGRRPAVRRCYNLRHGRTRKGAAAAAVGVPLGDEPQLGGASEGVLRGDSVREQRTGVVRGGHHFTSTPTYQPCQPDVKPYLIPPCPALLLAQSKGKPAPLAQMWLVQEFCDKGSLQVRLAHCTPVHALAQLPVCPPGLCMPSGQWPPAGFHPSPLACHLDVCPPPSANQTVGEAPCPGPITYALAHLLTCSLTHSPSITHP